MTEPSRAPDRPSPDALLNAARRADQSRGRLKIFLGAAPGVGKTFEMLTTAQAKARAGLDVVVDPADLAVEREGARSFVSDLRNRVLAGYAERAKGEPGEARPAGVRRIVLRHLTSQTRILGRSASRGRAQGRPRVKLVDIGEMVKTARAR